MNTTELAQHIVQQSDGTTLDELRSRSKALSKSLRKIRMLERQLDQDGDTNQLQHQWSALYLKTHQLLNASNQNWQNFHCVTYLTTLGSNQVASGM